MPVRVPETVSVLQILVTLPLLLRSDLFKFPVESAKRPDSGHQFANSNQLSDRERLVHREMHLYTIAVPDRFPDPTKGNRYEAFVPAAVPGRPAASYGATNPISCRRLIRSPRRRAPANSGARRGREISRS